MRAPVDEILPQLAALACIPEAQRTRFYKLLPGGHGRKWAQEQRRRAGSALFRNGALAKAAHAMRAASKALDDLSEKERRRLELALKDLGLDTEISDGDEDGDRFIPAFAGSFEECASMSSTLADALGWAVGAAPAQSVDTPRRRGRPKGAKGNRYFHMLVRRLLWASGSCGGKLPFDRKKGAGEPLVRAIYLLKPLLPDGFLPNVPPLPTIERIASGYRKNPDRFAIY